MRRVLSLFLGVAVLIGCVGGPRSTALRQRIPEDAPFLLAPGRGYDLSIPPTVRDALTQAHRDLVERSATEQAHVTSASLLRRNPDLAPAMVLEAQALLVEGRLEDAAERLRPVVRQLPQYDAALLALGRATERLGLPVEALEAYGALLARSQLANSRFAAVRPAAVEQLATGVTEALGRQRLDEAESNLSILRRWAPEEVGTLRATAEVAAAEGDADTELGALRQLSDVASLGQELRLRQAHLELDVGDASSGLRIFQDLSNATPDDPRLAAELARAQFLWRLGLLPEKVKEVADLPELKRADLAVLLYWLFPSVRYGQANSGRIANDVLDHPHRQEIVRVANLGIMSVDSRLHRFAPDQALTRASAIVSILRVLAQQRHSPACLSGANVSRPISSGLACELGVRCGLLEEVDGCLPREAPSGRTALEWTRRALDQLGVEQE